jgi:hypothetical protein
MRNFYPRRECALDRICQLHSGPGHLPVQTRLSARPTFIVSAGVGGDLD